MKIKKKKKNSRVKPEDKLKPKDLDKLIGRSWRKYKELSKRLVNYHRNIILEKVKILNKIFKGNKGWQNIPTLFKLKADHIKERAEFLDKLFGSKWKKHPRLLILYPPRIEKRLKLLLELFPQTNKFTYLTYKWLFTISEDKLKKLILWF